MSKYINTEPNQRPITFTINEKGTNKDIVLQSGDAAIELPEDNLHVKALIAKGIIAISTDAPAEVVSAPAIKDEPKK